MQQRILDMAIETKNDLGMTSWTGMCHGWAPAAVSTARPEKAIQVQSVDYEVDGKKQNFKITFYPDELKGLMTLAFANTWNVWSTDRPEDWNKAQPNLMPMKGGACRLQFPQRAAPSGRIIEDQDSGQKGLRSDNACDDPSPAFWHLTVIHSLKMMNQGLGKMFAGVFWRYFGITFEKLSSLAHIEEIYEPVVLEKKEKTDSSFFMELEMNCHGAFGI
jgi:hypothetical protein